MKKKIAVIGSSPIMILLAYSLLKNNDVTIFEKNKILGGAWLTRKILKDFNSNIHTNVIVPLKKKDENYIVKINKILKKLNVKIKKNKLKYEQKKNIKLKEIFEYDFSNFYASFKKKLNFCYEEASKIYCNHSKVYINNKEFDIVYLPYYSSIKNILIKNKKISTPYKLIKSKHLFLVLKKNYFKGFFYNENFSKFFDRVQIIRKKKYQIFIARISKNYKLNTIKFLINKLHDFKRNDILYKKINIYENSFRNKEDLKKLIKIKRKNIHVIDTSQFFESFKKYFILGGFNFEK